ncbi:3-hydroxybutyryl-dehydrogenase [Micractinium conductrix]|uniref:3-hydroxybutyryl-dehydrogenase n=1 Tax=Micractinium conductrix TaxID=554055 RepID=A0A2P6V858_9CHLO|nr:3-hydroxybutyryl-dehydrogenase [Micractinium conductrix]|eukprot:PSC70272.1 3-hydroxybutyryl-dehydrogenase [Micractinium conductrix]
MARGLPRLFGVVGAGQMGAGIAQVAATCGLQVVLVDAAAAQLDRATAGMRASLRKLAAKGRLPGGAEPEAVMARLTPATQLEALEAADYIVEAVPEREELKAELFRKLESLTQPHAVLASNTSSISITRLAAATARPDRVVGLHFMNPVPLMGLIELVRGMQTSDETFEATQALAAHLGKVTCVSQDRPGFIVNRILMPMVNEAFYTLMEGVGTPHDIDTGMRLGTNVPMGPLTLADFIGLDTCLAIMRVLHQNLGDDKYRPCPLLIQYVDAGWLGKKSGRGVYSYSA